MRILFRIYLLLFSSAICAQGPAIADASQRLIYFNPSFAGSNGNLRNQAGFIFQHSTRSAGVYNGVDAYIEPIGAGISASGSYYNQFGGKWKTTGGSLGYAQYLRMQELLIVPSVNLLSYTKMLDTTAFAPGYFHNVDDIRVTRKVRTLGAGLLITYRELTIGAYGIRLGHAERSFPPTPLLNLHLSYNIFMENNCRLNIQLRYEEDAFSDRMVMGLKAIFFRRLMVGAFYDTDNSSSYTLGYFGERWMFGAGYHAEWAHTTFGGVDAMLSLNLYKSDKPVEKMNLENF